MAQAELKLRHVEFSKAVRGYSCDEVDTYLAYANDRYTALARECVELRRKMAAQAAGQNEYREEALKEKEKIAAEAEALADAGKKEAARLVENARLKAARLLADAETAAAAILREAEEKAAAVSVPAEPVRNPKDADFISAQNNVADRLVAEIETFRQSVFNMYAKHIEELEELGRLTDRFYEAKESISNDCQPEEMLVEELSDDRIPEEADFEETLPEDVMPEDAEDETEDPDEEMYMPVCDFVTAETEEAGTETSDEDILASLYTDDDDEDDELLRIDWSRHRAAREPAETDLEWDAEDDAEDDVLPGLDMLINEEEEEAEDGDIAIEEDLQEDFLSDFVGEYLSVKPAAVKTDAKPKTPGTLDDLFEAEEEQNVSLTGEFDFIYNTKKSADNVAQIRRQPLIDAQKPQKPKKHGNK